MPADPKPPCFTPKKPTDRYSPHQGRGGREVQGDQGGQDFQGCRVLHPCPGGREHPVGGRKRGFIHVASVTVLCSTPPMLVGGRLCWGWWATLSPFRPSHHGPLVVPAHLPGPARGGGGVSTLPHAPPIPPNPLPQIFQQCARRNCAPTCGPGGPRGPTTCGGGGGGGTQGWGEMGAGGDPPPDHPATAGVPPRFGGPPVPALHLHL